MTSEFITNNFGGSVRYFKPLTYGIDVLTAMIENKNGRRAVQLLNFISSPLDAIIQLAATPIFAAYDLIQAAHTEFKRGDICQGITCVIGIPIVLPIWILKDTVMIVFSAATRLFVYKTALDVREPERRAQLRINTWNQHFPDIFPRVIILDELRLSLDKKNWDPFTQPWWTPIAVAALYV